jgi:alkanesulfonate monooxygenase SsuD/methylene tetrahydromethanopterin reductase-like flavin-dependent oxidoreductase (luciferase family)
MGRIASRRSRSWRSPPTCGSAPPSRTSTAAVPLPLAQSAASIADLAPGRFEFGIGSGSQPIIEMWNSGKFIKPATRVKEMVQFLRKALAGERVVFEGETFQVNGFRLSVPPEIPPKIHVAALREGMLKVAGEYGDGAIINWLSAEM